ncbi:MAG: carboxypeptidase-like regulatory domain-containing protein [Bacteroidales bacterium]|nr:carboxypeptidase-like regulatory domain-containing protein [Bacteroidales bacterium]
MKHQLHLRLIFFLLILVVSMLPGHAQVTKIMGTVINAVTGEPIPFVNLYFEGTSIGATSGFEGQYAIETFSPGDSLTASYVGYISKSTKITPKIFQRVDFALEPDNILLEEVVILPGENPAEVLLRKVIENKEINNKKEFDAFEYEVYTKVQFDANNITESLQDRKLLKPFNFIFNYMDTSTLNGKAYLPVFLSETMSEIYYRRNPKENLEIIVASKLSGVENESITQFLGDLNSNVNIYDNYITLFQKNFVSPIANFGLSFYKYYLVDSMYINNQWCYHLMFKPRRKQELTFSGTFWVHDSTYAIKQVEMEMARDMNLNFVSAGMIRQEYSLIDGKYWMLTKDYLMGDFNLTKKSRTIGVYGHRSTSSKNFVFNEPRDDDFYKSPVSVIVEEDAMEKDDLYWGIARHDSLTSREKGIYEMIDSIKSIPIFETYLDLGYMLINGYYIWGNFELGPYYKLLSFNAIEGARFRLGGQTSNKFSNKLMIDGHIAYGTKDRRFKFGLGFLYMLNTNPRRALSGSYLYDMVQLGQSQDAFSQENFFAVFFRRNPANKLSMLERYKIAYEHEWVQGFSNTFSLSHRKLFPVGDSRFIVYPEEGVAMVEDNIISTEIGIKARWAHKERYILGEFTRITIGTKYPIFEVLYGYGIPSVFRSEYEYHRLQLQMKQWFNVFSIGWSKYILEAGKIWGILPYPLLKLQPANETFLFDEFAYNLMNYYEFINDQYISIYYTHHFDGFFLNHVPLMRKLKWRGVIHGRALLGSMSKENESYSEFPGKQIDMTIPYYEAGVGVENIFKFIRVDVIWRLNYRDTNNPRNFGVFISAAFSF